VKTTTKNTNSLLGKANLFEPRRTNKKNHLEQNQDSIEQLRTTLLENAIGRKIAMGKFSFLNVDQL